MSEKPVANTALPIAYALMYERLAPVAREHGYALTLHGSLVTDLDLVAVPWTESAGEPMGLIDAICEASGGEMRDGGRWDAERSEFVRTVGRVGFPKPHGRLVWTIHLGGGPYIDISVMPRQEPRITDQMIEDTLRDALLRDKAQRLTKQIVEQERR